MVFQINAQENCTDFDDVSTTGNLGVVIGPGNSGLIDNQFGNWFQGCAYLGIKNDVNSLNGTNYLHLTDVGCGNMGSKVWNSVDYSGNWITKASCFCYDYNIIKNGTDNPNPPSAFTIYNGSSPTNSSITATFVLNDVIQTGSGWHTICPPIALADSEGNLPSNALGYWRVNDNGTSSDWDQLISNVGGISFSVDIGNIATEQFGIDNICFQSCPPNQQPNPPAEPPHCCGKGLGIANPPNTPAKLPVKQSSMNGTDMSIATETFQIHDDASIPITEISVSLIDLIYKYDNKSCSECINNPALWGSIFSNDVIGANGLFTTAQNYGYSNGNFIQANANQREIVFTNPRGVMLKEGDKFDLNYVLPPASDIPCCVTEVVVCTKISWKDANCCYNDINTCSTIQLGDTPEPQKCECGKIDNQKTVILQNGKEYESIECGGIANLPFSVGFGSRPVYSFQAPEYRCDSKSCTSSYSWEVTRNGNPLSGSYYNETGQSCQILFPSRGSYTVIVTPICGGEKCDPCVYKIKFGK